MKEDALTKLVIGVLIALVIGGLIGFSIGVNNQQFSSDYMRGTASMMGSNGKVMMQMGRMTC